MSTRRKKPNPKRTTQQDSPLLDLPAELRNNIYEMIFEDNIINVEGEQPRAQAPGLLVTCRQFYNEGIGVYYACASVYGKLDLEVWSWLTQYHRLESLGSFRKSIKKVLLDHAGDHWRPLDLHTSTAWLRRNIRETTAQYAAEEIDETRQSVRDVSSDRFKVSILAPNQEMIWTTNPVEVSRVLEEEWAGEYTFSTSVD